MRVIIVMSARPARTPRGRQRRIAANCKYIGINHKDNNNINKSAIDGRANKHIFVCILFNYKLRVYCGPQTTVFIFAVYAKSFARLMRALFSY